MTASEFKILFMPHCSHLYSVALKLTGNGQEAEDLVQDTLLRLWTGRHRLPSMTNSRAYASMTLVRLFYDLHRKPHVVAAEDVTGGGYDALADGGCAQSDAELSDEGRLLMALIEQLPAQQRSVMMMKDVAGMTVDEVCQQMDITAGAVRTALCHARTTIRNKYIKIMNYGKK